MKPVFDCSKCSNMIVSRSAGFICMEHYTCAVTGNEVEQDDGCTFGDDDGPSIGYVPYDIDLSVSQTYQTEYDMI